MLASVDDDGMVWLWDPRTGEYLRELEWHEDGVSSVAFAPDGATLASAGYDGMVRLWDVHGGKLLSVLEGYSDRIEDLAFAPDGVTLASAGDDGVVRLWNMRSGKVLRTLHGHHSVVRSIDFAPDGATLASAGEDGFVHLWDVRSGKELRTLAMAMPGHAVIDIENGKLVEACGDAWRYLKYLTEDAEGKPIALPWEVFGPLPAPTLLQESETCNQRK